MTIVDYSKYNLIIPDNLKEVPFWTFYTNYYFFLLFFLVCSLLGIFLVSISYFLGTFPKVLDLEKTSVYECGFEPFGDNNKLLNLSFYKVALLFLVFDVEIIFLVPWCLTYKTYIPESLLYNLPMFLFYFILIFGLMYEYLFGALSFINIFKEN